MSGFGAKYGLRAKQSDSSWWKDVISICEDGDWYKNSISKRVGDGKEFLFWDDVWWGTSKLRSLFQRLFILSSQKEASIFEMGEWRDNRWCWNFSRNRELLDREKEKVEELKALLRSFSPQMNRRDSWVWIRDGSGSYTVKSAYEELRGGYYVDEDNFHRKLWSTKAPSISIALAWKVSLNRIQCKVELARRNALPPNSGLDCSFCQNSVESCSHLFFSCDTSWKVWQRILKWYVWV